LDGNFSEKTIFFQSDFFLLHQLDQLDQLDQLVQPPVGADLRSNFESHHQNKILYGKFSEEKLFFFQSDFFAVSAGSAGPAGPAGPATCWGRLAI
jgi:hypothetical protein